MSVGYLTTKLTSGTFLLRGLCDRHSLRNDPARIIGSGLS